jgi:hypothetical protein
MSYLNSSVNSSTEALCTLLQIYPLASVRHWKGRVAFTGVVSAIYTHGSMKQICNIVILINIKHNLHNALVEKVSLLQKLTNYYYGPNPLRGFNALLKRWKVRYVAGCRINDVGYWGEMCTERSVIAHVHGFISQQLLCIDSRCHTAIFHLLLHHVPFY